MVATRSYLVYVWDFRVALVSENYLHYSFSTRLLCLSGIVSLAKLVIVVKTMICLFEIMDQP